MEISAKMRVLILVTIRITMENLNYPETDIEAVLQEAEEGTLGGAYAPEEIDRRVRDIMGRPKLDCPEDWGEVYEELKNLKELYSQWEKGEMTLKEFREASGFKTATFYSKLLVYEEMCASQAAESVGN